MYTRVCNENIRLVKPDKCGIVLKELFSQQHLLQEHSMDILKGLNPQQRQAVDIEHKCYEIQFDKLERHRSIMMTAPLEII